MRKNIKSPNGAGVGGTSKKRFLHPHNGYLYLIKNPISNEMSVCASEVPLQKGNAVIAPTRYGLDYAVIVGSASSLGVYAPGSRSLQGACIQCEPCRNHSHTDDLAYAADSTTGDSAPEALATTDAGSTEPEKAELEKAELDLLADSDSEAGGGVMVMGEPQGSCADNTTCIECHEWRQELITLSEMDYHGDQQAVEEKISINGEIDWIDRVATKEDAERFKELCEMENEALLLCREKVVDHGLDMKLVSAHYMFGEPKIIFFFTADNRVDFRDLVKDLVSVFRIRIELRQIGVRDESRILGGLAVCGRD